MRRLPVLALLASIPIAGPAYAQYSGSYEKPVQWHVEGGLNVPTGSDGDLLSTGWNFGFGVVYRPPESMFGVRFDVNYWTNNVSAHGVYEAAGASRLDISGGWVDGWSGVLDGELHHAFSDSTYGYALAGIGAYYVKTQLTEVGYGYVCNPWWYYCYPGVGDVVVASNSSTHFGWNLGVGIGFHMSGGSSLFVEARYVQIDTPHPEMKYIPIVIGVRF